jgi:dihydroorotase
VAGARRWAWLAAGTNAWQEDAIGGPPFDPALRVNPPLRTPADAEALAAGLADGTVDAIATDHAPHRLVDKEVEFGLASNGISGIETALGVVLEAVNAGRLTLLQAIEALTAGPQRVLAGSATAAGTKGMAMGIRVGEPADLVLFDPSDRWVIDESSLRSLGKNSPLLGRSLPGRVLLTVARGRLAYVDDALA